VTNQIDNHPHRHITPPGEPTEVTRYLSLEQLSKRTGLSKSTLTRLFKQNKLPGYQPGGPRTRIVFPHNAIELAMSGEAITQTKQPAQLSGPAPLWKKGRC